MKIVVVDDEKDIQILFQQKFRKEIRSGTVQFHFAFSGEEGLQYLQINGTNDIYLVLSDINMPGMNGLELLKMVKKEFPELMVYMITAYGDEHNYREALANGCDEYLTKPLNFDDLKNKILNQDLQN
jgi:CheY-like chemotaxis protein